MIRKVLLSTVAVVAIGGTAFAADLPSRRAPPVFVPPPIPVFSWTGFYVGGQVGFAFGRDSTTQRAANGTGPVTAFNIGPQHGVIGGGHVGYNFSTQSLGLPVLGGFGAGGLVIGVEGDVDGTDYRATQTFPGAATGVFRSKAEIEGSARGRVGVAVDRALFFATGGAAFAQFENGYAQTTGANQFATTVSNSRVGYTVGGGAEYAITTQWSLRAEYRYSDFGTYTQTVPFAGTGNVTATHKIIQQRVQLGFSYKFDSPVAAPVVARY